MRLGELPRAPEKLLLASRSLRVTDAKRYRPLPAATWCNIYLADVCDILQAPIPHLFDPDGAGPIPEMELRANHIVDGLRAKRFNGWFKIGTMASISAAITLANEGHPVVATWANPNPVKDAKGKQKRDRNGLPVFHAGHVVLLVPTPEGKRGAFATGAGRRCVEQCPIAEAFGLVLSQVELWHHE